MTVPAEFWGLGVASLAVLVCVVLHALALRFWSFVGALALSLIGGALVVVIAHGTLPPLRNLPVLDAAALFLGDLGLFGCGWYAFQNVVGGNESSIRFRILEEITAAGGHIAETDLFTGYNDLALIRIRLEKLQAGGQIVETEGHYRLASRQLVALARLFWFLKRLILRSAGEFDPAAK